MTYDSAIRAMLRWRTIQKITLWTWLGVPVLLLCAERDVVLLLWAALVSAFWAAQSQRLQYRDLATNIYVHDPDRCS